MHNINVFAVSFCVAWFCSHAIGSSLEESRSKIAVTAANVNDEALCDNRVQVYYLNIQDFIGSLIQIPTSNVSANSSTIASSYLAGAAPIYNNRGKKFGTCSASFLSMQNQNATFTDISNYLSVDNGLIVSWLTPSTLANLELDNIINGMVTECIVTASTKVGFNPYYGQSFNMVVSSDSQKIYFKLTRAIAGLIFNQAALQALKFQAHSGLYSPSLTRRQDATGSTPVALVWFNSSW